MGKDYQCSKCGNIYKDEGSDKFVKTLMRKCPVCGSTEVSSVNIKKRMFTRKTNK